MAGLFKHTQEWPQSSGMLGGMRGGMPDGICQVGHAWWYAGRYAGRRHTAMGERT